MEAYLRNGTILSLSGKGNMGFLELYLQRKTERESTSS